MASQPNATLQGTGLKGQPVDQIIKRFYGNIDRWPTEPDGINFIKSQIRRICEHISKTGDCLWHAQSIVLGGKCNCASCVPPSPSIHGKVK